LTFTGNYAEHEVLRSHVVCYWWPSAQTSRVNLGVTVIVIQLPAGASGEVAAEFLESSRLEDASSIQA